MVTLKNTMEHTCRSLWRPWWEDKTTLSHQNLLGQRFMEHKTEVWCSERERGNGASRVIKLIDKTCLPRWPSTSQTIKTGLVVMLVGAWLIKYHNDDDNNITLLSKHHNKNNNNTLVRHLFLKMTSTIFDQCFWEINEQYNFQHLDVNSIQLIIFRIKDDMNIITKLVQMSIFFLWVSIIFRLLLSSHHLVCLDVSFLHMLSVLKIAPAVFWTQTRQLRLRS